MSEAGWIIGIDIGGTFTDVVAANPGTGAIHHLKVPSSREDPGSAVVAALDALAGRGIPSTEVRLLLHGTTVVTNAIIERRLARTALVTTAGFKDVLEIGRHWRRELYDPFLTPPEPLVPRELRLEVGERLDPEGNIVEPLDEAEARRVIEALRGADVEAVAVAFLHAYRNSTHEERMAALLEAAGGWVVCRSTEVSREIREYECSSTTVLNTALIPLASAYLDRLERRIGEAGVEGHLYLTQSNGGALPTRAARRRPVALALSGPVAGVVACCDIGRRTGIGNLIGLDMGGTSTDIAVIDGLAPRFATELAIGGLPVRLPSIEIHSIGAGGGSIAAVDAGGSLRVGPQSAGADPGPVCYGRGGERPTVTDCQLLLGRLSEDAALAGSLRLDAAGARHALARHIAEPLGLSLEEAAAGVVEVANAAMEAAVRVALRDRGDDPRDFALVAFGGAGPLHACELARRLNIATVIVPPHPGTLSALGVLSSEVRLDHARSELHASGEAGLAPRLGEIFDALEREAAAELAADPALASRPSSFERSCDMRYVGQAYDVTIAVPGGPLTPASIEAMREAFHRQHQRAYGFANPGEPCAFVTCRLAARVRLEQPPAAVAQHRAARTARERPVHLPGAGFAPVAIHDRDALGPGSRIVGPAVIHQLDATTFLPPFASATPDASGNLIIAIDPPDAP